MENKTYPNYKLFLESLDYNKEEIEKYFNILTKGLKEEVSSLLFKRDEEIEKLYKEYEESNALHEKIKIDILTKYFKDFIEINEDFNHEVQQLRTDTADKINSLIDTLEIQKECEHNIKSKLLLEFFEEKKPYQKNIDEVNKKIDKEYEDLYSIIFDAKERVLSNSAFYDTAKKHIEELDNSINFFNELVSYNKELNSSSNDLSIESDENKLLIYIDYLKNEKENFMNLSTFIDEFKNVDQVSNNVISEIEEKERINNNKLIEEKTELYNKFKRIDEEKVLIQNKYDSKIASCTNSKDIKNLKKIQSGIINSLENKKELLVLESYLKNDLIRKENESIQSFKNSFKTNVESIKESYISVLESNKELMVNTFDSVLALLNDELFNIKDLKESVNVSKDIIDYFNRRFKSLEVEKRVNTLQLYKEYLVKNMQNNQELDCLAFEILTSDQLLKIKELDIKRNYLTIDDELKIKEIKYDKEIEEIERLKNIQISIRETLNSIDLIKKDLSIDYDIKKKELDSKIKNLDYIKNLDILSSDYMSAYTRLQNLSKIAKVKGSYDLESIDLSTTLKLEEVIEASLIEATEKKTKYEYLISKYNRELEDINNEKAQRMRYMNNVLEIERNNFEKRKNDLKILTKNLENEVIPDIIKNKRHYGLLLQKLDAKFSEDKNKILNDYKNDNKNVINCQNDIDKFVSKFNDFVANNTINNIMELDIHGYCHNYKKEMTNLVYAINNSLNTIDSKLNNSINKEKIISSFCNALLEKLKKAKVSHNIENINSFISKNAISFSSSISVDAKSISNKYRTEPLSKIERKIERLESDRKNIVAYIAINNVISSEESFEQIDKIRKSKNDVQLEYEKQISDYKKTYLQTIDFIKNDYETKLSTLNSLKHKAINDHENEQKIIDNNIRHSSDKLKELNIKTKENIKNDSDTILKTSNDRIAALSAEVQNKKNIYENYKESLSQDDKNYRDNMIVKARNYFDELENKKHQEIETINNLKKDKESKKESYIKELKNESLRLKELYKETNANIEDDFINKKVDNTIKYGRLFNKYKEEQENDILKISDSIKSFDTEVMEIISSTIDKKQEYENMAKSNSDSLMSKLEEKTDEMNNFYKEDN